MKLKDLTKGALLTALSIVIPIIFAPYKIIIPPFSATLTAHVPMFLSMLINPTVALMVGIGSAIGFLLTTPIHIAARGAMHIVVGYVGALLIKKGKSPVFAFAVTLPIHAVLEALVVIPFGFTAYQLLVVVGVGTAIHHAVDATIAYSIIYLLNPYLKLIPARK